MQQSGVLASWAAEAGAFIAWAAAKVCASLPSAVTQAGWRLHAVLLEAGPDRTYTPSARLETSWLGARRRRPLTGQEKTSRAIAVLPRDAQYRRTLSLSRTAARRGRRALELRRDEFSPIPADQSAYAFRAAGSDGDRVGVQIALVRRSDLDRARDAAAASAADWRIAGECDERGDVDFILARSGTSLLRRPVIGWLAVYVALLILLISLAGRFEREVAQADTQRGGWLEQAREIRSLSDRLDRLDTLAEAGVDPVPLPVVMTGLSGLADSLPEDASLERIRLSGGEALIVQTGRLTDGRLERDQTHWPLGGEE